MANDLYTTVAYPEAFNAFIADRFPDADPDYIATWRYRVNTATAWAMADTKTRDEKNRNKA